MTEPAWCEVLRPTPEEFARPFQDYVAEVFKKNRGMPMFKVIPPEGWKPRSADFPPLQNIKINTPIRQNVFGTKGSYRCIFEEQPEMSVDEFKHHSSKEDTRGPEQLRKMNEDDDAESMLERSFWSSVTLNPPLYGADTPVSFFDAQIPYGWNLRDLRDLLSNKDIPQVPGVTTPMTYFGMWRSFFGWHKEDADLLSINYVHWGAPKVWYCVSPRDQGKFERMVASLFPELHKDCEAFIRHKDILLSPQLLRAHNIPFVQSKQHAGEFIVLNAAAYHSGFNMGFNCAEAINFATPAWIEVGKAAVPCRCRPDAVRISMKLFDPTWLSSDDESDFNDGGLFVPGAKRHQRIPGRSRRGAKRSRAAGSDPPGRANTPVNGKPYALVGEDEEGDKFFALVERVAGTPTDSTCVVLRWLKEGADGLYRPEPTYWEEKPEALLEVRTQYLPDGIRRPGEQLGAGWKLLTLRSKILGIELDD